MPFRHSGFGAIGAGVLHKCLESTVAVACGSAVEYRRSILASEGETPAGCGGRICHMPQKTSEPTQAAERTKHGRGFVGSLQVSEETPSSGLSKLKKKKTCRAAAAAQVSCRLPFSATPHQKKNTHCWRHGWLAELHFVDNIPHL